MQPLGNVSNRIPAVNDGDWFNRWYFINVCITLCNNFSCKTTKKEQHQICMSLPVPFMLKYSIYFLNLRWKFIKFKYGSYPFLNPSFIFYCLLCYSMKCKTAYSTQTHTHKTKHKQTKHPIVFISIMRGPKSCWNNPIWTLFVLSLTNTDILLSIKRISGLKSRGEESFWKQFWHMMYKQIYLFHI